MKVVPMAKAPEVEEEPVQPAVVLTDYTCTRCGFHYQKSFDFDPLLCYRCMRFIAKRTWTTIHTLTPPARTERGDI